MFLASIVAAQATPVCIDAFTYYVFALKDGVIPFLVLKEGSLSFLFIAISFP